MKTEFVKQMKFENSEQLEIKLFDSVNWYNRFRPHSSLQY
ncbi:IS3 family transposase [Aerococcaceae bacterium WGS1372]